KRPEGRAPAPMLVGALNTSWGEGEPFSPRRKIQTSRLLIARCVLFPLPEGEGQGEGKRRERPSGVSDHSRHCRTRQVLRRSRRFRKITTVAGLVILHLMLMDATKARAASRIGYQQLYVVKGGTSDAEH